MLNQKALIVYVSVSEWGARKKSKDANATVQKTHATKSNATNTTKRLLPDAPELQKVNRLAGSIRDWFRDSTLPWFRDGARLLKAQAFMEFSNEFRKRKAEFESAVNDLVAVYPQRQAEAQAALGSLYNSGDYPTAEDLLFSFACAVDFMPIPEADFRIELGAAEKRALVEATEARIKASVGEAMQDAWKRLYDVVKTAADRLAAPGARFQDSLLQNVLEMTALLPKLNVTDDPELETARAEIEKTVARMSPDVLRDNATERQDAASKLSEIMNSMGAFMGAPAPSVDQSQKDTARLIQARLGGAKFEGSPGANLGDGIIIQKGE